MAHPTSHWLFPPHTEEQVIASSPINSGRVNVPFSLPVIEEADGTFGNVSTSNPMPVSDYYIEVGAGLVANQQRRLVVGHNDGIAVANVEENIWEVGGIRQLPPAAEVMNIVSTSALDTSPSGTGLRTLVVRGIGADQLELEETVALNGTTPVATTNAFLRVNQMQGLTAGSTLSNQGDVTITGSVSGFIQDRIATHGAVRGDCITQGAHWSFPSDTTGLGAHIGINVAKISGGANPLIIFRGYARNRLIPNAAEIKLFDLTLDAATTNWLAFQPVVPLFIPPGSDVVFTAEADVTNAEIRMRTVFITKQA